MSYHVTGGIGGPGLPGVLGPRELDARSEWVPSAGSRDLVEALSARLGSEVDLNKVVLAVLCPLRPALEGPALEALLARLPLGLAYEIAAGELGSCGRMRPPAGARDYLLAVSRRLMHPPPRAVSWVRAVFAAARTALGEEGAEEIAARLPSDLADLWRRAR